MKNNRFFILLFIVFPFFIACKSTQGSKNTTTTTTTTTTPKTKQVTPKDSTFTEEPQLVLTVLDSSNILTFFKDSKVSVSNKEEIEQFYKRRDYQYAWVNTHGLCDATSNFYSQYEAYITDFADSSIYNEQLYLLITEAQSDERHFKRDSTKVLALELLLTQAYFEYAPKAYGGKVKNPKDLEWYIPTKPKNYQLLLDTLVSTESSKNLIEPVNNYYVALKAKLREYRTIEQNGGWPTITAIPKKPIKLHDDDSCITSIKKILFITGDYKEKDTSITYTDDLERAIRDFQARMGLTVNGKIDASTIKEMNIPVSARIKQIMVNMERLKWMPAQIEPDLILVNVPEFKIHVFENNKLAWSSKVVVGQTVHQTNIFKGSINNVVLNPYWTVPVSIIKNEMVSKAIKDPNYFRKNNLEVLSGNTAIDPSTVNWANYKNNLTIRQKPGKDNSLGRYKFMSHNSFSIFLHDTPAKELFGQTNRAFSHGCIRLSEPDKLAQYLLRNDNSWNEARIQKTIDTKRETYIPLKYTLPVYIVYFTSWVDHDGKINFRNDIYGRDKKLASEIFGN